MTAKCVQHFTTNLNQTMVKKVQVFHETKTFRRKYLHISQRAGYQKFWNSGKWSNWIRPSCVNFVRIFHSLLADIKFKSSWRARECAHKRSLNAHFAVELVRRKLIPTWPNGPWKMRWGGGNQKNQRGVWRAFPYLAMFDLQFLNNIFFF